MSPRPIMWNGVVYDNPYIDPPTIEPGVSLTAYRLSRPRKRTLWQRLVRRLNGHG